MTSPDDVPDARFLLANERTALAYVRTGLAMLVAGLAGAHFLADDDALVAVLCLVLVIGGVGSGVAALTRYRAADRAIRSGRAVPRPLPLYLLAATTIVAGVVGLAYVVLRVT